MTEAGEMLSFWQSAARRPDRVALVEPDGTQRTAGELLASANQIVHGLRARGLSEGDCVALSMTNCGRVLELYLAGDAEALWAYAEAEAPLDDPVLAAWWEAIYAQRFIGVRAVSRTAEH